MIPYDECHFIGAGDGGHLRSLRTGVFAPVFFKQEGAVSGLYGFDGGGDDLHVVFHGFIGDVRVLEFLNRCVAECFDLPARIVSVQFGELEKRFSQRPDEPVEATGGILLATDPAHFIIPRPLWIEYREQHATRKVRLQAALEERG